MAIRGSVVRGSVVRGSVVRGSVGTWAVIGATAVLAAAGWRSLAAAAAGGPSHAMVTQGVVLIGPAVLALVVLALAAERLWPAVARPLGAVGHRQDAAYLALYALVAIPAVTLIGAGAATVLQHIDGGLTLHPFAGLPRWALVAVVLVLIDLANWTSHLSNHRVDAFWRFHALHHSQEEMSILTSFRAHPLVHTSFQLTAVPLIVLGTGGAVPATVLVGYVVLSTMPHANVNWGFGPLRYLVVSPAYHRLHHDRDDRRGVNLGTVLVVWDVMAGLAVFPGRERTSSGAPGRASVPVATGLAGRPLPVEQALAVDGAGMARTMGRQLLSPIRGMRPALPAKSMALVMPARSVAPVAPVGRAEGTATTECVGPESSAAALIAGELIAGELSATELIGASHG